MKKLNVAMGLVAVVMTVAQAARAQSFGVDPIHSTILFRIHHFNAGMFWGRFNDPAGTIVWHEGDPAGSSMEVAVQTKNLDTHNAQRDRDLSGPDFFNSRQYTEINFKSTSIKLSGQNKYEVQGSLTIKGITKPITATVEHTGMGKDMRNNTRAGFEATFTISRKDFGVTAMPQGLGDEVKLVAALECVQK
jgi:polyisoprenoid-binding protein YceI